MKIEAFIVQGPCIFSAFCNFNFQLLQAVPHFLVLKVSRNLSKFLKAEKVQSVPNQTCAVFNSFLETLHVWFKYFFDFYGKILSNPDVKIFSNLSKLLTLKWLERILVWNSFKILRSTKYHILDLWSFENCFRVSICLVLIEASRN